MRSRRSPCLRAPSIEWFRAGGERPARWDVAMDRRRRGELFVPVFAPALRILSDRRLDRQRAAPRSSIQFDRSCRFRWQASPWVWAVSGWSCPRPRQCQRWLRPSPPQDPVSPVQGGANFLRVQALSGVHCLDLRPLGVGFLGCFLRRKIDLGPRQGRRGTLDIGPPQARETKQAKPSGPREDHSV